MYRNEGFKLSDQETQHVMLEGILAANIVLEYAGQLTDVEPDENGKRSANIIPGVNITATNRLTTLSVESMDGREQINATVSNRLGVGQTVGFKSFYASDKSQLPRPGMSAEATISETRLGRAARFISRYGAVIHTARGAQDDFKELNNRFTEYLLDRENGKLLDRKMSVSTAIFRKLFSAK